MRRRTIRRVLLVLAGVAPIVVATPAFAQDWPESWERLGTGADGSVVYMQASSIRDLPPVNGRSFVVRQVWVGYDYRAVKTEKATKGLRLQRYTCQDRTFANVSIITYGADGQVIQSVNAPGEYSIKYVPVVPGSVGEGIWEAVCSPR